MTDECQANPIRKGWPWKRYDALGPHSITIYTETQRSNFGVKVTRWEQCKRCGWKSDEVVYKDGVRQ